MDEIKDFTPFEVKIISRRAGGSSRGFTLIELLVVIAIIDAGIKSCQRAG